jgi:serine/threonine protein kinase
MGTNKKTEHRRRQHVDSRPQHYCVRCTAVRGDEDAVCADCDLGRPTDGWGRLEDAFDPFLGRVLNDRYLITKIEGRGGSSTIYRAESLAIRRSFSVSKHFAIKMVKLWHSDEGVTEEVRTRLEREVRAVGMLKNPHIVRVYELVELDQNWIALVMDHVDGQTLEERIEANGPMSVSQACALMRQIANGLCEAHDVGMIHRDIKPANLMLELLPDGHDFAFLLDFGVVHLDGEAKVTQGFLGTPLFASPEQATSDDIDRRSDIYSLGATFFYMLTGRAPFDSERTLEVLDAHVTKTPPRLSQVCPERSFPPFIERLVAKMLAKAPADRPESLYEVLEELQGLRESSSEPNPAAVSGSAVSGSAVSDPAESADLSTQLGVQESTAFQDRPKTMLGVRHAVEILPTPGAFDSDARESTPGRARRDSSELSSLQESSTGGFVRPLTRPKEARSPHLERAEIRPNSNSVGPKTAAPGIAFARRIRQSGACSEELISLVDSQNQVWTLVGDQLIPVATPLSRVCSVSASEQGAYVGLSDGSINRVLADQQSIELLFGDDGGRPITALASARAGTSVLAGTSDGTLYLGQLDLGRKDQARDSWLALHANRGIAAVALTSDGGVFAAASVDGFVRIAATNSPGTAIAKLVAGGHVRDMAFGNDGYLLALLLDSGRIPIFQVLDARQISVLSPDCPTPQSLYFSDDNILYGVSNSGGRIARWNLTTGRAAGSE